jgi:hypothetical protein
MVKRPRVSFSVRLAGAPGRLSAPLTPSAHVTWRLSTSSRLTRLRVAVNWIVGFALTATWPKYGPVSKEGFARASVPEVASRAAAGRQARSGGRYRGGSF